MMFYKATSEVTGPVSFFFPGDEAGPYHMPLISSVCCLLDSHFVYTTYSSHQLERTYIVYTPDHNIPVLAATSWSRREVHEWVVSVLNLLPHLHATVELCMFEIFKIS